MQKCELAVGAIILYELFEGRTGSKNRYFIVISNSSPSFECFTTTTRDYPSEYPALATEYCEIRENECCLPKRCFVDLRNIYPFDDILLSSWLRSGRVKKRAELPIDILKRIQRALANCRSRSKMEKTRLNQFLALAVQRAIGG